QAGRAALALGGTADAGAQDFLLQSGGLSSTVNDAASTGKVIDLLNAALERDPNYADAYVLKSRALEILAANYPTTPADMVDKLAQAEAAAKRAIVVAPKLGSAYTALALIAQDRLDFASALKFNMRAAALSPEDPN